MENAENVTTVSNEVKGEGTGKGLIIAAVVGAVILVGGLVYKKVIAPAIAKRKALKESTAETENTEQDANSKS